VNALSRIKNRALHRYLCVDIGGTTVKAGILAEDGAILLDHEQPTPREAADLMDLLTGTAEDFASTPIDGVPSVFRGFCVSTTGVVDPWRGEVLSGDEAIKNYGKTPLRVVLEKRTGLPVEVENDVNCALLGEHWLGAARNFDNAACITVGTGIGGAFMADGRLYRGARFNAMEVGHIPFFPSNWEQRASARSLAFGYVRLAGIPSLSGVNGRVVLERAQEKDEAALRSVEELCFYLAQGIATLLAVLAPDVLVLGGGIAGSMDFLLPRIRRVLDGTIVARFREKVNIRAAELGNRAGLVGALRHFSNMRDGNRPNQGRKREKKGENNF
jgi:predicted NBD/HSP70 family sugar kinase